LLHGITNSSRCFEWLLPSLTRFRVLRLDFRGHGSSGRAPGAYQPQDYVDDAVATLETLTDSPAIVIGHSLGGITAAALAQQRPDLVKAMVLIDPPLVASSDASIADSEHLDQAFRLMQAALPGAQAAGMAPEALAGMLATVPTSSGEPASAVMIAEAMVGQAAGLLDVDVAVLDPVLNHDLRDAFDPARAIPAPTLLITADPTRSDCLCRPEMVANVEATSPAISVHVVHGAGHMVFDEIAHRAEVRGDIEGFLAAH
jgi:pimeloyl-ACP methyl ester carboxylesterase